MSTRINAESRNLGELLGAYAKPIVLPQFQRSYSWGKDHIAAFWEDLAAFRQSYVVAPSKASYFLGSVVILKSEEKVILLDGQQRMATATIVLASIRDVARTLDGSSGKKIGNDFARDIQRDLVEKDTTPATYALTLSDVDEDFFAKTVKTDPPLAAQAKLRSHKLIEAAAAISRTRVEKLVEALPLEDAVALLKSFRDSIVKGMEVIAILVDTEEDAFNIFETLNDRALRLSVPDLVLNLLMRRAASKKEREALREKWNEILRQLGRRDISRFLRHMWVSKHGDVKAQGLFTVIKENLTKKNITSGSFADECAEECETYVALLELALPLPDEVKQNVEGFTKYLDVQPAMPLLLSAYRSLSPTDFGKLVSFALVRYIRHGLIANQNPLELESAFYEAARVMRAKRAGGETSAKALAAAKGVLQVLDVDDATVEVSARDLELERSQAIWLMTNLANRMQSKTKEVAVADANLEHIFPQNPGSGWSNIVDIEPYTWHIGNLTILSTRLNRQAQNRSFLDKKSQYYSKSEIKMTQALMNYSTWDSASVKKRAIDLSKEIVKLWR